MKTIIKQMVVAAFLMTAMPVFAADNDNASHGLTKGTKSYQSAKINDSAEPTQAKNTVETNPAAIETAAGAAERSEKRSNSLRNDLRLPRKN